MSTVVDQEKAQTEQQTPTEPESIQNAGLVRVSSGDVSQPQGCDASLFNQYDWSVSTAVAICKAESGGNADALSTTCDRGLMQINCVHADMVGGDLTKLYDPTTNIQIAYRIYSAHGWSAWSTFNSQRYLAFF